MNFGDGTVAAPHPAATVVMLRDAAHGLEVFLLRRHGLSEVLGGAYVFPGGKTDREDLEVAARLPPPLGPLHAALGEPELTELDAAALYVTAVREVDEEAHVTLAAGSLVPWARWVTPVHSRRARQHFDARFFLAAAPAGQDARHDGDEATASEWLTPRRALQHYWERKIDLPAPQIMSLAHLSRYPDVAHALADARSRKPPRIQPVACEEDGMRMVCYPGDPLHALPSRVLPGPTRLVWRGDRYEPVGGLETLLA